MTDWTTLAACRKSYDHRFFGGKKGQQEVVGIYCRNCVVKGECTALKVIHKEAYGTWGGHIGKISIKHRNQ